jgi:hypothetical protein
MQVIGTSILEDVTSCVLPRSEHELLSDDFLPFVACLGRVIRAGKQCEILEFGSSSCGHIQRKNGRSPRFMQDARHVDIVQELVLGIRVATSAKAWST